MPRKILKIQPVTVPQVKAILQKSGEEKLDQFQKRSLDYAVNFSKTDPEMAEKLLKELVERFELGEEESVEIVDCMPKSVEEIRIFLAGGRKIVETSKLEAILSLLDQYRKEEQVGKG